MVLLDGTTGLRRGELIALRWRDTDLVLKQANVTHSVGRNVEGDTKTEASRKPVPLPTLVVEELKKWRKASLYRSDDDFLFPSIARNGTQPISPDIDPQTSHPAGAGADWCHKADWLALSTPWACNHAETARCRPQDGTRAVTACQ